MIANSTLAGFDAEQQNLLATLMRYHLKGFKRSDIRSTNRYQYRDIMTLLRLFRLAVLLNRSRQATHSPQNLALEITSDYWQLQFDEGFLTHNPLIYADLQEEQKVLNAIGFDLQAV